MKTAFRAGLIISFFLVASALVFFTVEFSLYRETIKHVFAIDLPIKSSVNGETSLGLLLPKGLYTISLREIKTQEDALKAPSLPVHLSLETSDETISFFIPLAEIENSFANITMHDSSIRIPILPEPFSTLNMMGEEHGCWKLAAVRVKASHEVALLKLWAEKAGTIEPGKWHLRLERNNSGIE